MKKLVALLVTVCMCLSVGVMLTACGKEEHTHTYGTEWSMDATHHWHEATCEHTEEVSDKAEHTFGAVVVDEEPTPVKKGHGHKTCSVCDRTIYNVEVDYQYDPNVQVTLIFDVRGGKAIEPVTVKAGTTIDLTQYTVERTDGASAVFEGWTVGGEKVESLVLKADMVAHAAYSCDPYMDKQNVKIGKYPQTIVSDQNIIAALEKMEMGDRNSNGYYEYQGEEYAKEICTFDSNTFRYEKGKAYYFKVEPITWVRVNGRWTTLQVIDFVNDNNLLEYLNGNFYNRLTAQEKAFIGDTKLNANQPYKFYLWNVDKFASSHQTEAERKLSLTDYALFRDDTELSKENRFTTKYWLLNPVNSSGIDTVSYYTFTGSSWQQDASYMGKSGLLPCFDFDFNGIERQSGDKIIRVTFDSVGGSQIPSVALIAGEKYRIAADYVPQKEGVDFIGWALSKDGNNTRDVYDETDDFTSDKDVTLYARWGAKAPKVYTIEYELNGGAFPSPDKVKKQYSSADVVTFATPQKDATISYNYEFKGWYLEEDFKTKVTSTKDLTDNVKLYAKWEEKGIYFTIEYDTFGGTIVETDYPKTVLRAESSITLPTTKKNGYKFIGWKTEWQDDLVTSITANRTGTVRLTAWYINAYNVTWDLNGGTLENESELPKVIYADAPSIDFTKFVPRKDGYKFMYWIVYWLPTYENRFGGIYKDDLGQSRDSLSFEDGSNLPKSGSSSEPTIEAGFSQAFTLTVDLEGGNIDGNTAEVEIEFAVAEGTVAFVSPTKEGKTLKGWAVEVDPGIKQEALYYRDEELHTYFTVNEDGTTTFTAEKWLNYDSWTGEYSLKFEKIYAIWE